MYLLVYQALVPGPHRWSSSNSGHRSKRYECGKESGRRSQVDGGGRKMRKSGSESNQKILYMDIIYIHTHIYVYDTVEIQ